MKAYIELINEALNLGFSISVISEEELEIDGSTDKDEIVDMVENLDMSWLEFYDSDRCYRGSATINLCVDDDETVSDYSINHTKDTCAPQNCDKWIQEWFNRVVMA